MTYENIGEYAKELELTESKRHTSHTAFQMKQFDARKLCEPAVFVMKSSVDESRDDDTISPKVGAVAYFPEGYVEVAFRGELRVGDHAEFTLLERKNREQLLEDVVLFATLEPCAPGARNQPKRSCAERIVLARIKTVRSPGPPVSPLTVEQMQQFDAPNLSRNPILHVVFSRMKMA